MSECGASGGTGIGAGHECICVCAQGHEGRHGCGAMWAEPETESEVLNVETVTAESIHADADTFGTMILEGAVYSWRYPDQLP